MNRLKLTFAFAALLVVASVIDLGAQSSNTTTPQTVVNGTTGTTQAVGDNSTKLATTAYVDQNQNAPAWARWLGDGSEGAGNCSTTLSGEHWYSSFTVSGGNTCSINNSVGVTIRSTGACTINGTIDGRGITAGAGGRGYIGSTGGGSGGGAATGTAGGGDGWLPNSGGVPSNNGGGTAGGSSGGNGGNGTTVLVSTGFVKGALALGPVSGYPFGGADGAAGGSSGGAKGNAGTGIT